MVNMESEWARTAGVLGVAIDLKMGMREFLVAVVVFQLGRASTGTIKKRLGYDASSRVIEQRIKILCRKGVLKRAAVEKGEWKWPDYEITKRAMDKFASCAAGPDAGSDHGD